MPRAAALGGVVRLLGHVGGGVVTRDRVLRHQQADAEDVPEHDVAEVVPREARVVDRFAEHVAERLVVVGHDEERQHDHDHADDVPPRRDHVEHRGDAHVEDVDQHRDRHHDRVHEEDRVAGVRVPEDQVEERRREDREAVADGGRDGDLPDQVEPAGEPAPAGAAELRGPVVEPACRGVRRCDLGHRECDDDAEAADDQPAPGHGDRVRPTETRCSTRSGSRRGSR